MINGIILHEQLHPDIHTNMSRTIDGLSCRKGEDSQENNKNQFTSHFDCLLNFWRKVFVFRQIRSLYDVKL